MSRIITVDFSRFSLEGMAEKLENVKWNDRGGFKALCPAHEDSNNSLSVDEGDNGRTIFHCFAGCEFVDIMQAIYGETKGVAKPNPDKDKYERLAFVDKATLLPDFEELFGLVPDDYYFYTTATKEVVGYVLRIDNKKGKRILPLTPWVDHEGNLEWRFKGFADPHPLYMLDLIAEYPDEPVIVVEGEKTADAADELLDGPIVTTWLGGANAVNKTDWSPLRGRHVTIWPDADETGLKAAETVAQILTNIGAASVKIVELPDILPKGWDLADDAPDGVDIKKLLAEAKPYDGALINYLISAKGMCELDIPPRELIVVPFILANAVILLFARRGVGKTWFGLSLALAIATGKDFLCYEVTKARHVMFIDGEMPAATIKQRLELLGANDVDNFDILSSELLYRDNRQLNIGKPEDRERIEQMLQQAESRGRKPEVIILDNLSSLRWGRDENDNSALDEILQWLLRLRHLGYTVVMVHHAGKGGDQRGASRLEDPLDTTIKLEEIHDGEGHSGARMKMSFTKVRGEWPDPDELVIQLVEGEGGILEWDYGAVINIRPADATLNTAYYGLNGDGSKPYEMQKELAEAQGIQPAAVSKHLAYLKRDKLVEVLDKAIIVTLAGKEHLAQLYPDETFK